MTEALEKEIFKLKKYIEILEEDSRWCYSMINKQQRNPTNFSDLPDNSWEKVMYKVVEFIGGDAPALCNWSDEIPTQQKVAESILTVVAYGDNRDPDKFINLFNEYRQENRYFPESDFEKVEE